MIPPAPTALYLHIPFCRQRCRYCDFATSACRHDDPRLDAYAAGLERLVREAQALGALEYISTAYIGGGTPTMLAPRRLSELLALSCARGPVSEISFEANPESLSDELLDSVCATGATRVSIGVQSFNDNELRALGRIHTAQQAQDRVRAAVAHGLRTSIDLMCGIPYQTTSSWEQSLKIGLSLGIEHVSCYPLIIEPGTPLENMCESGTIEWPSDDTEARDMETAERILSAAEFARYEVASYAQPGAACRHNIAYWTGAEYLGLGTSAASMLGRSSYEQLCTAIPTLPNPDETTSRLRLTMTSSADEVAHTQCLAATSFEVEQLTEREELAEDLMLAARMSAGIPARLLMRARPLVGTHNLDTTISQLQTHGFLYQKPDGGVAPTHQGWLLGNELYGPLWDLAHDE